MRRLRVSVLQPRILHPPRKFFHATPKQGKLPTCVHNSSVSGHMPTQRLDSRHQRSRDPIGSMCAGAMWELNKGWHDNFFNSTISANRNVCCTLQKCGLAVGHSVRPKCTNELTPDPSLRPLIADARSVTNVCKDTLVAAMACRPLGQAALVSARTLVA